MMNANKVDAQITYPNTTYVHHQCGERFQAYDPLLPLIGTFTERMVLGGYERFPNRLPFLFEYTIIRRPLFWGLVNCFVTPNTMETDDQCLNCLQHVRLMLIDELCRNARSAEYLVEDCFLHYSYNGPFECDPQVSTNYNPCKVVASQPFVGDGPSCPFIPSSNEALCRPRQY